MLVITLCTALFASCNDISTPTDESDVSVAESDAAESDVSKADPEESLPISEVDMTVAKGLLETAYKINLLTYPLYQEFLSFDASSPEEFTIKTEFGDVTDTYYPVTDERFGQRLLLSA
ncbi:MAG TPA: hypothetical protein PLT66_02875 [Bacillota bacterium]|nr:hypothetical protein [Bacillota bacterium]